MSSKFKADEPQVPRQMALAELLFAPLIPDLQRQTEGFRVNTDEVDAELLEIFFQQLRMVVVSLRQAMAARDGNGLRQGAHSLQGMGGTIGAPELSVVGVELRSAARQENFEHCDRLLVAIEEWLRQTDPVGCGAGAE